MTFSLPRAVCLCLTAAVLCGCDAGASADEAADVRVINLAGGHFQLDNLTQFKLPGRLREISGLALTQDGTLLGHNDELGIVYQLDVDNGLVGGYLQLGNPPARDDFEGIAITAEQLYLVTSSGAIYEADLPSGRGRPAESSRSADNNAGQSAGATAYRHHDAELPCEVEGLAFDPDRGALLAACKHIHDDGAQDDKPVIRVYAWDLARQAYDPEPALSLRESDFEPVTANLKKLRPSGITITHTGNLLLVTRHGSKPALLEVSRDGTVVQLLEIPWHKKHEQTEGIVLTNTNQLLLADEGSKNRKGRLGVYQPD